MEDLNCVHEGERIGFFKHHYGNRVGWKRETKEGGRGGDWLASRARGLLGMRADRAPSWNWKWRETGNREEESRGLEGEV